MDGSDLEAIKAQLGSVAGGSGSNTKGNDDNAGASKQDEQRQAMLTQIVDPDAMSRLKQMAIVKADKVRAVEDMLIRMAQMRQIKKQVTEQELKELLAQINAEHEKETKIVYNRKGYDYSDDDEEYDFD
ncbi:hypothetical protein FBU31_004749 [Coemansia sp. 'formosensis']|uniref:Uncharacterized protein n=1 Tax=Coemansia furcata TaxID=417177 RepID=A0ACC1LAY8_9FUNG|nr:hypothetical protein H4S07_004167 [Coemansia furcata]KAJ2821925.1 hypothetical protein FBU31_004749 [Coemansia sp. 'formosensis']